MADKLWKASERAIAGRIGGERVPITGRQRGSVPDVKHQWLSVECKCRQLIPMWLKEALAQAHAAVRGEQLPVAILHEAGQRHDDDIVCVKLAEFVEWFGHDGRWR